MERQSPAPPLLEGGTLAKQDLARIEAEDILKSRVFSDTEHDSPDGVRDIEEDPPPGKASDEGAPAAG